MAIKIKKNILLAPQTTFKIGGVAKFFVEVHDAEEIIEAITYARENKLEIFILAGGSNVLISDNGFEGLVVKIKNSNIEFKDTEVSCDAGVPLMKLVNASVKNGLHGLEWAAGIPGTVGGAIRGNAGAFGGEINKSVLEVGFVDTKESDLKIKFLNQEECAFNYRDSIFKKHKNLIIVSIKIKLEPALNEEGAEMIKKIIKSRIEKQPQGFSAGSFFKNPVVTDKELIEKFEHDVEMKIKGNKVPAGWFIEDLGFKGKKIGGAQISSKHANFIINTGNAKAEDVIILSSFLKQKVRDHFGIQLDEEISMIGF